MPDQPVIAYFDGLCEPRNPGGHACGGYAIEPHPALNSEPLAGHRHFRNGQGATNNIAEYESALLALRSIYRSGYRGPVVLRGDSQLVVRHFTGQYQCNAPSLIPLLDQLRKAGSFFASLTLEWVPREQNEAADRESRLAYREATGREAPVRRK